MGSLLNAVAKGDLKAECILARVWYKLHRQTKNSRSIHGK